MAPVTKQLSNPFSTGAGGSVFENRVQAAFVALMLAKGVCPCLPSWPINKVKLQGKYSGFTTDDVIIFTKDDASGREARLMAQIKHAPSITQADTAFAAAIQSAWSDFNNPAVFQYGHDAIALITGPLTAADTYDVRDMLEIARAAQDSTDFFEKVNLAKFSSEGKRQKLEVFQHHLKNANDGNAPDNEITWKLLKSFHLLGYDLDVRAGLSVSLLHSLIGASSNDDVEKVWLKILNEVQSLNPRAGVMSLETLPQDLLDCFRIKLPPRLSAIPATPIRETIAAAFLGSWDENAEGDKLIIEEFTGMAFASWQDRIRDAWLTSPGIFEQKDGRWRVLDRRVLWDLEGHRVNDAQLDQFKDIAVKILREHDPALEFESEDRFAAAIHGKETAHSGRLRKGIAETLALMATKADSLSTCSTGKAKTTALVAVRAILGGGDWNLWTSLNDVLPLLAEASPDAFLEMVEETSVREKSPFKSVFAQEEGGAMGRTYITGLLWGLESLAWAEPYLIPVCRILSNLAAMDPGGKWSNRPSNSLTSILLPWFPQTCASTAKRHAAVRVVAKEQPEMGWRLVLSLLPETHGSSMGTHKPTWQPFIPEDRKEGVPPSQYWEDVVEYGQLGLALAGSDIGKLVKLVERYFRLPSEIQVSVRSKMTSDLVLALDEPARFQLWLALTRLTTNHRKFADHENWQVPEGALETLDAVADRLRPTAPEVRHQRLFGGVDADLYEEMGNWDEQRKKLEIRRQDAVREIWATGGSSLLLKFAADGEEPWQVGFIYGSLPDLAQDEIVLPSLLDTDSKALGQFAGGYVWGRHNSGAWGWVDAVKSTDWSPKVKARFFIFLPFCEETWKRVESQMGADEAEYWRAVRVNPYGSSSGIELAIEKLIAFDRADAAIHCLVESAHGDRSVPSALAIKALDALKEGNRIDAHEIGELITGLQRDKSVTEEELRRIEWSFLLILGQFHHGHPVSLSWWMADDPNFFCEVIRKIYRSNKDTERSEPSEETKTLASKAYHLMSEWYLPPGTRKDHTFDHEALSKWVQEVKAQCIDSGYWEVAGGQIGRVLFYAPRDENGLWINPVCSILDGTDHSELRRGLTTEIFNSRGGFSYTAGAAELKLAEEWDTKASLAEIKAFSRVGQELRRLADSYRRDAEREAKNNPFEPN